MGILVEKGRIWYQSSLSFTPGRATRLASSRAASGDGGGRRGDMWHPGQPRRVPGGSSPDFKSRRLKKKKKTKKNLGGGRRGCTAPGPPGRAFPGWVFFLVLLFLLKYESPFQRSLLRCDYPRAIKKERKKNTPNPYNSFCASKQLLAGTNRVTKSSAPRCRSFQAGWEPGGRRDEPAAAMNQGSGQPPASWGQTSAPLHRP